MQKIILYFCLVSSLFSFAGKRYWRGNGSNLNWNNTVNWSTTSGGSTGASVPATNDTVYFDNGGTGNCTINTSVNIKGWDIASSYTGQISQNSSSIMVGSLGFIMGGGTFLGYSNNMAVIGPFNQTGGTFQCPFASLEFQSGVTRTAGNFADNGGTVVMNGSFTIDGEFNFFGLEFANYNGSGAPNNYTITTGSNIIVADGLYISGSEPVYINNGTIHVKSNIFINNTAIAGGGSATLSIEGLDDQKLYGSGIIGSGILCKVIINKADGVLSLIDAISVGNNWTYTKGTVENKAFIFVVCANMQITSHGTADSMSFQDFYIYEGTAVLNDNISILGPLTINPNGKLTANNHLVNLSGDWYNEGIFEYGTSEVIFDGEYTQTIKNNSGPENFYKLKVFKGSGDLQLLSKINILSSANFYKGVLLSTSNNYPTFNDNATALNASNDSYVTGPVRKKGNDTFTFPTGGASLSSATYHPISISAPNNTTDELEALYNPTVQTYGSNLADSIESISSCEYWTIKQTAGTPNVKITLGFNNSGCAISDLGNLMFGKWDAAQSKWVGVVADPFTLNWPMVNLGSAQSITLSTSAAAFTSVYRKDYEGYASLKEHVDASYIITKKGSLRFKLDNQYAKINTLNYKILNMSNQNIRPSLINNVNNNPPVNYGLNRIGIDLFTNTGILPSGIYILEVTDQKKEKKYLRFKI